MYLWKRVVRGRRRNLSKLRHGDAIAVAALMRRRSIVFRSAAGFRFRYLLSLPARIGRRACYECDTLCSSAAQTCLRLLKVNKNPTHGSLLIP